MQNHVVVRTCGECTLCCKLSAIQDLPKPAWSLCQFCKNNSCAVYSTRPKSCRDFTCSWLVDQNIPDNLRPDKIHMYATSGGEHIVNIRVDNDHPDAIDSQGGKDLIEGYRSMGNHVLLITKDCVKFICGHGREKPVKIQLDWVL